ncbi:MAG: class I SAM-dependent methyltransferase [Clostridia bacterium]|nr:class I SAM-dependent methyltransferase [Clostridia bacterium]
MNGEEIIKAFYASGKEDGRLASQSGAVEFRVTTSYVDRYLRPGDRIIEIGCATGRYSLHYARRGHAVTALDLVESNLDVLRAHVRPGDDIEVVQGNALDLSRWADESFDAALLLGPMYHLYTEADKLTALQEALRVTKRGGLLFAAYCQFDAAMIQSIFSGKKLYDYVTQSGLLDEKTWLPISNPAGIFELHRKEDVDRLDAHLEADRLHYVGTDMFTYYIKNDIDQLDAGLYDKYISYTMSICENQHLVGASNHTLDVLRKR